MSFYDCKRFMGPLRTDFDEYVPGRPGGQPVPAFVLFLSHFDKQYGLAPPMTEKALATDCHRACDSVSSCQCFVIYQRIGVVGLPGRHGTCISYMTDRQTLQSRGVTSVAK